MHELLPPRVVFAHERAHERRADSAPQTRFVRWKTFFSQQFKRQGVVGESFIELAKGEQRAHPSFVFVLVLQLEHAALPFQAVGAKRRVNEFFSFLYGQGVFARAVRLSRTDDDENFGEAARETAHDVVVPRVVRLETPDEQRAPDPAGH